MHKRPTAELVRRIGQLIVGTYSGSAPSPSVLRAVRTGELGGVIVTTENSSAGLTAVRAALQTLQRAARSGGNPGLLVMTDQEGGEVRRLPGPPTISAAAMGERPGTARDQAAATARLLKATGVNIDLAPVADVAYAGGFIASQARAFGANPTAVAEASCAFARALRDNGVGAALKHFPGLGSAATSTDVAPVAVNLPGRRLRADAGAYRRCGSGPRSLVMMSSASYPAVTGHLPAVLAPRAYQLLQDVVGNRVTTISDAMDTPALSPWPHPARTALSAGLDLLLYANSPDDALETYRGLVQEAESGVLAESTIDRAAGPVSALKQALGLTG